MVVLCFLLPMLVPWYFWGESLAVGYFVPGLLRYSLILNATWLVNSAAHIWGNRPYDKSINPRENSMVALSAIGEKTLNSTSAFCVLTQRHFNHPRLGRSSFCLSCGNMAFACYIQDLFFSYFPPQEKAFTTTITRSPLTTPPVSSAASSTSPLPS